MSLTRRGAGAATALALVGVVGLAGLSTGALRAQAGGTVFVDANRNGRLDGGERGLAGVAVSNQHAVVTSDATGRFALATTGTGLVFVSVPSGYRSNGPFWRRASDALQFPLVETAPVGSFTFVHGSDPHVQPSTRGRLERVRAIVDSLAPAFVLMSGDLVKDALRVPEAEARGYYELYTTIAASFPVPVWSVPGNHELFGIERHHSLVSPGHPLYGRGMYRSYLGPDYYSFNHGGVHFVALNTVDHADLWYHGHVDSAQASWLAADLAQVPDSVPVVTFGHIPLVSSGEVLKGFDEDGVAPSVIRIAGRARFRHTVSNVREVLRLLWQHPYPLALQGHTHLREALRFGFAGPTTRFETAAAIVSGWEDGPIRAVSSVTVYRVAGGRIGEGVAVPIDPR